MTKNILHIEPIEIKEAKGGYKFQIYPSIRVHGHRWESQALAESEAGEEAGEIFIFASATMIASDGLSAKERAEKSGEKYYEASLGTILEYKDEYFRIVSSGMNDDCLLEKVEEAEIADLLTFKCEDCGEPERNGLKPQDGPALCERCAKETADRVLALKKMTQKIATIEEFIGLLHKHDNLPLSTRKTLREIGDLEDPSDVRIEDLIEFDPDDLRKIGEFMQLVGNCFGTSGGSDLYDEAHNLRTAIQCVLEAQKEIDEEEEDQSGKGFPVGVATWNGSDGIQDFSLAVTVFGWESSKEAAVSFVDEEGQHGEPGRLVKALAPVDEIRFSGVKEQKMFEEVRRG